MQARSLCENNATARLGDAWDESAGKCVMHPLEQRAYILHLKSGWLKRETIEFR